MSEEQTPAPTSVFDLPNRRRITPSPFMMVATQNSVAGKQIGYGARQGLLDQLRLVKSELTELEAALEAGDFEGTRMEACDVIYTALGLQHLMGVNGDEDFLQVVMSQDTKFDYTEEDALKTARFYDELGVETIALLSESGDQKVYVTIAHTEKADHQIGTNGKIYENNKWLKGLGYTKPVFTKPSNSFLFHMGFKYDEEGLKAEQKAFEEVKQNNPIVADMVKDFEKVSDQLELNDAK